MARHAPRWPQWRWLAALALAMAWLAACTPPPDDAVVPEIQRFVAVPPGIEAGGEAVLEWETSDASDIVITDGSDAIVFESDQATGGHTVSPDATTTYTLTATNGSESVQAETTVTVTEPEPTPAVRSVDINETDFDLQIGDDVTLSVDVDAVGGASDAVDWTVANAAVVTIDVDGRVTAISAGTTTITATSVFDDRRTDTVDVTVTEAAPSPAVLSVDIQETGFDLQVGDDPVTLTVDVQVVGGASTDVTWSSSDPTLADVDGSGAVTGLAEGPAEITATSVDDDTRSDTITVTITAAPTPPAVIGVTIEQDGLAIEELDLVVDGSDDLDVDVQATGGASTDVTWSSDDPAIATVDGVSGLVTAISAGTTTITATSTVDDTQDDTITVTITTAPPEPAVTNIEIDQSDFDLQVDDAAGLTASVAAVGGASEDVDWTSGADAVATVDASGVVIAVAVGTADITATSTFDGTRFDTVTVTVVAAPPDPAVIGVSIDQPDLGLDVDQTADLTATVDTVGGAADTVTWSSSDIAVATIDATSGHLVAVAPGTTTITATSTEDTGQAATITVTVTEPDAVTGVTVEPVDLALEVGDSEALTATVSVTGSASQDVTWSSGDGAVATVDANGIVDATAAGTTEITATSVFDGTRSDSITVTVTAVPTPTPSISSFDAEIVPGSQVTFTWGVTDTDSVDVLAVLDSDSTDTVPLATGVTAAAATVGIPASDRQTVRLVAHGGGSEATQELILENVVVSSGDSDPYDAQGRTPDPEIPGTLREVVLHAAPGSVIGFASDIDTVTLHGVDLIPALDADGDPMQADAHLIFRDDVTLSGPPSGITIEGVSGWPSGHASDPLTWRSRVILVPPATNVQLENLTITGGDFIYYGGGIQVAGTLTIRDSTITGNRTFGSGGGIHVTGTGDLTVIDSAIDGNEAATYVAEEERVWEIRGGATVEFGGVNGFGGGIAVEAGGTVLLQSASIVGNDARVSGGGLYNVGTATLEETPLTGNVADNNAYDGASPEGFSYGGAVANFGQFTMTGGTLATNVAAGQGGGLYHGYETAFSTLVDVSIADNVAGTPPTDGYGGGIMHHFYTGEENRLAMTGVTYAGFNDPQDLLTNNQGPRPSGLRSLPPTSYPAYPLNSPDLRH